jgi:indolepyruvate ferredoxin oxidoreductase alpha subunit
VIPADAIADALRSFSDTLYWVPGFPVTELGAVAGAELVVNEKCGLEYALGDSLSGRRAAVVMKNVGLNACTDPLVQATNQGLRAGVVIVAGDDPEAAGSQSAEDSRYFGELAQVPVIEPDLESCIDAVEAAFEASEDFSRISILRLTPPLLASEFPYGPGKAVRRRGVTGKLADPALTMRGRDQRAREQLAAMFRWSEESPLNRMSGKTPGAGAAAGSGGRVVTVYPPPPLKEITGIREIGRPFLKEHLHLAPPATVPNPEQMRDRGHYRTFCRGCPFSGLLTLLKERGYRVITDAGCSILAMNPPYHIGVASYGLGASIAVAARSTGIALTGDYALLHNGISALIDVYSKRLPLLCLILVNRRMGMTGGQEVPDPAPYLGFADPVVCDAEDLGRLEGLIRIPKEPRTVIIRGTCPDGGHHETVAC